MITTAILTPVGDDKYRVSNVGQPPFWPHDGDIISRSDIPWLTSVKGWQVKIVTAIKEIGK